MSTPALILTPPRSSPGDRARTLRFWPSVLAALLFCAGLLISHRQSGSLQFGPWLLGGALGFTLAYTVFGFSGAWRRFLVERRGAGLYAQLFMLTLATLLFYPALAAGELFGAAVGGITRPVGVPLLAGALLFGVGMQLAGACVSGALAGLHRSAALLLTLAAVVAGATWASADYGWWQQQPTWFAVSLLREFGVATAVVVNLGIIAAAAALLVMLERRRHGRALPAAPRLLWFGAAALALLNFAVLAWTGRPWVIADAFPLWGARLAELTGAEWDFWFWEYWSGDARQAALEGSVWQHSTSVMNFGIILGALAAAGLRRRAGPATPHGPRRPHVVAALLGGLLLGYGAVIGLGCNIGAFVGGVVSGSLHGWVWLLAAFTGSALGVLLRPLFGLRRL